MHIRVFNVKKHHFGVWILIILLVLGGLCLIAKEKLNSKAQTESLIEQVKIIKEQEAQTQVVKKEEHEEPKQEKVDSPPRKPTLKIPKEYDGWEVLGKLTIPKINLVTYIISTTTPESLNKSVTKLYGPGINQVGNFCITGHNYRNSNMFSKLKKLEVGDEITLTDLYERSIHYRVYTMMQVEPDNVDCLEQETGGEREVTLITCTPGALKRLIVKTVEIYD